MRKTLPRYIILYNITEKVTVHFNSCKPSVYAVIPDDNCALASAEMNVNLISHRNVDASPLLEDEDRASQNAREQVPSICLILPQWICNVGHFYHSAHDCQRSRCELGMRNNSASKAHLVVSICWRPHQRSMPPTFFLYLLSRLKTYKGSNYQKNWVKHIEQKTEWLFFQRKTAVAIQTSSTYQSTLAPSGTRPNGSFIIDSFQTVNSPLPQVKASLLLRRTWQNDKTCRGLASVQRLDPNGAARELLSYDIIYHL